MSALSVALAAEDDAGLEARLEALGAGGAEALDGPGLALARALVARGEALGGAPRDHLRARAAARVAQIERALASGREAARQAIAALVEVLGEAPPALHDALARGDLDGVRRAVRRRLRDLARERRRVAVPWAARLHGEARSRGAALPEEVSRDLDALAAAPDVAHGAHASAAALGSTVSSALFRASAESVRAAMAVARAADNVPADAGPYNAQVLAARALSIMAELAPAYLQVVVTAVDDLAALEARLAVEPVKGKSKPPPKKPAKKRAAR